MQKPEQQRCRWVVFPLGGKHVKKNYLLILLFVSNTCLIEDIQLWSAAVADAVVSCSSICSGQLQWQMLWSAAVADAVDSCSGRCCGQLQWQMLWSAAVADACRRLIS